ncbi:MAG: hypothetical protein OEU36_02210 [Gammaproteobacteria bacterium]|nr:hypothetical protein [Gammaproteobacteria bacterium]
MTWIIVALIMGLLGYLFWSTGYAPFRQKRPVHEYGSSSELYEAAIRLADATQVIQGTGSPTTNAMTSESEPIVGATTQPNMITDVSSASGLPSADTRDDSRDDAFVQSSEMFRDPHLRDSIRAIEVTESSLDDQMDNEDVIKLLQGLLERSPDDAHNRHRLLSLLYAAGEKSEFVRQVQEFKQRCKSIDKQSWNNICEMGRSLAPESDLFNVQSDIAEDPDQNSDEDPDKNEHRAGVERRKADRRVNTSSWLGVERRKRHRRRHYRRTSDLASRGKH